MFTNTSGRAWSDPVEALVGGARILAEDWLPLPRWAASLTRIGAALAGQPAEPEVRSTVALLLPTRDYAAVLCAAGAVLQRLSTPTRVAAADRFALLSTLAPGTAVTYRSKATGAGIPGELVRCDGDTVVVRSSSTGSTILINRHFAHAIEVAGSVGRELPALARSKAPRAPSALVGALLGDGFASGAHSGSRLECCIVGTASTLRAEIVDTRVGLAGTRDQILEGTFQEVLQVRSFVGSVGVFRSDVIGVGSSRADAAWSDPPEIAIFDGAASLLKCGSRWPGTPRIVLLDKTDTRSTDAAAEINREYVQRVGEPVLALEKLRPQGCELLSYRMRLG